MTQVLLPDDDEPKVDLRAMLARSIGSVINDELLQIAIAEAFTVQKKVRHEMVCKHCNRASVQYPLISDVTAVMKAIDMLTSHTQGRPDVAKQESGEKITFQRVVHLDDD